jgi:ribosomal protein S18 acetylase RimI-like enzyme
MTDAVSSHTIHHLPAGSELWAPLLLQFMLQVVASDGQAYAGWAHERLQRAVEREDGVVALSESGQLLGMLLFEEAHDSAELTLPWTRDGDAALGRELAEAALQVADEQYSGLRYRRAERQILPERIELDGLQAAGFTCRWRRRMLLELLCWRRPVTLSEGCRLAPWHVRYLDAAAEVVYRANAGTTDAELYGPFFGDTPAQCRRGLLSILAGRYGALHQPATQCAFSGPTLVGVNLVIASGDELASIIEISVDPAYQGRGLGRSLMAAALQVLRRDRYARAELAVTEDNAAAIHLYESLGFVDVGRFPVCVLPPNVAPA